MPTKPLGQMILNRFDSARTDRSNWDSHWQDVADLIVPTRDFTVKRTPGARRRRQIYDPTAVDANESLAAAVHGLLNNPATRWFLLWSPELEDRDQQVNAFLYECTTRMLTYLASPATGFPMASSELYLDLCGFGTGGVRIVEKATNLRFVGNPLSELYFVEDDDGTIQQAYRAFELRADEIARRWPKAELPVDVKRAAGDPKQAARKFGIVHAIYRRESYDPSRRTGINKPIASVYVLQKEAAVLSEGGFDRWPMLIVRWSKAPGENYGRGPGMHAIDAVKTLNVMMYDLLVSGELALRPPLNVPAGVEGPIRTAPGSLIYYKGGDHNRVTPVQTGINAPIGFEFVQAFQQFVEKIFFLDRLKLPERDRMTAEEIITRRQQGLLQASPVLARLYAEWLTPLISRVFHWMLRHGKFPTPPEQLVGRRIEPQYTSPLAQSMRANETVSIRSALADIAVIAQARPEVLDNLDADYTFRAIFGMHGTDPKTLTPLRMVQEIRRQRQEKAATEQTLLDARDAAAAAKDAATAIDKIGAPAA